METFILVLHVLIAIAMTGLILLQQGKGAEMGASFGAGASQTVFGSAGSAGFDAAAASPASAVAMASCGCLPAADDCRESVIGSVTGEARPAACGDVSAA